MSLPNQLSKATAPFSPAHPELRRYPPHLSFDWCRLVGVTHDCLKDLSVKLENPHLSKRRYSMHLA